MTKKAKQVSSLHSGVIRIARVHFVYILALAVQVMIYDAGKLITPKAVYHRWVALACMLVVNVFVWLWARIKASGARTYKVLTSLLIAADIAFASYSVYNQRGMASRSVALFAVPIIVSAILMSRTVLFATAALSVAAYSTTALKYFYDNFNEGYKLELYGEVGSYCVLFLILASLLWVVIRVKRNKD